MQTCKDVMTKQVSCCLPGDTARQVAQLMKAEDVGAVPVIDNQQSKKLQGMVTDRDIAMKIVAEVHDPKNTKIEAIMTREVVTCTADDSVEEALDAMSHHQIRRIPVVDAERRVIGIIAQADVATRVREPRKTGEVVQEISRRKAA